MPKDKELDEILTKFFIMRAGTPEDEDIKSRIAGGPPEQELKAAILSKYISRAEVLEMIGKDEAETDECGEYLSGPLKRNGLRAELRQKLGADHD